MQCVVNRCRRKFRISFGLSQIRDEFDRFSVLAFRFYASFMPFGYTARDREPDPETARCGTVVEKKKRS